MEPRNHSYKPTGDCLCFVAGVVNLRRFFSAFIVDHIVFRLYFITRRSIMETLSESGLFPQHCRGIRAELSGAEVSKRMLSAIATVGNRVAERTFLSSRASCWSSALYEKAGAFPPITFFRPFQEQDFQAGLSRHYSFRLGP